MKAVTAATGQPVMKALSQRGTKSMRKPILAKVTTALTTNTMMPVMSTGNMNLAFLVGEGKNERHHFVAALCGLMAYLQRPLGGRDW